MCLYYENLRRDAFDYLVFIAYNNKFGDKINTKEKDSYYCKEIPKIQFFVLYIKQKLIDTSKPFVGYKA